MLQPSGHLLLHGLLEQKLVSVVVTEWSLPAEKTPPLSSCGPGERQIPIPSSHFLSSGVEDQEMLWNPNRTSSNSVSLHSPKALSRGISDSGLVSGSTGVDMNRMPWGSPRFTQQLWRHSSLLLCRKKKNRPMRSQHHSQIYL